MSENICKCCNTPILEDQAEFSFMHDDIYICIGVFSKRAETAESELAKLKEENRWREYPDEKPEIGQDVWVYWNDDDEVVEEIFRYSALFCEYCETFAPHFDGYSRCIHPKSVISLFWKPVPPLPSEPEAE